MFRSLLLLTQSVLAGFLCLLFRTAAGLTYLLVFLPLKGQGLLGLGAGGAGGQGTTDLPLIHTTRVKLRKAPHG